MNYFNYRRHNNYNTEDLPDLSSESPEQSEMEQVSNSTIMNCTIPATSIKHFIKAITCLEKIGEWICFEISPSSFILRTLGQNQSSYFQLTFCTKPGVFFEKYDCYCHNSNDNQSVSTETNEIIKARIKSNTFVSSFRSVDNAFAIELKFKSDLNKLEIISTFPCYIGHKYEIHFENIPTILQAEFESNDPGVQQICCQSNTFNSILPYFENWLAEITLIITEQELAIVNCNDDNDSIETVCHLKQRHFTKFNVNLPLSVKQIALTLVQTEFKAFISTCQSLDEPIQMYLTVGGAPLLLTNNNRVDNTSKGIHMKLIVSTIADDNEPIEMSQSPQPIANQQSVSQQSFRANRTHLAEMQPIDPLEKLDKKIIKRLNDLEMSILDTDQKQTVSEMSNMCLMQKMYHLIREHYSPNVKEYKTWNVKQIIQWISTLENGKYIKFRNQLEEGFIKSEINGSLLPELTRGDLSNPPFNINQFVIKRDLETHFKSLTNTNKKRSLNELLNESYKGQMEEITPKKRKLNTVIKLEPEMFGNEIVRNNSNNNKNEKSENNSPELMNECDNDINILYDNINDGVIRILEDDINIKYCPKCKDICLRKDKDIKEKCSVMICKKCGDDVNFTYWCWDCSNILSIKDLTFHPTTNEPAGACKHCRSISRKRRNKCKQPIYKTS